MAQLLSSCWTGADLELRLANTLEAVTACRSDLARFCRLHSLDPRVANRLEVIFEELATNPIRHGFEAGSGQSVRVRLEGLADEIRLTFEDDGRPFDPVGMAAPPAFTTLEDATPGGLGIPLVRSLSSSFRYEPATPDGDFLRANRVVVAIARA